MTDARLRGTWLGKMRFDDLSDPAWRIFTSALMWCAEQGTDGAIPLRYVPQLHPQGEQADANLELVKAGIWKRTPEGFALIDWAGDLGQSTAEQVEKYRTANREKQARRRQREAQRIRDLTAARDAEQAGQPVRTDSAPQVVPEGTYPGYVGNGKGTGNGKGEGSGEGDSPVTAWPVVGVGAGWVDQPDGTSLEMVREAG